MHSRYVSIKGRTISKLNLLYGVLFLYKYILYIFITNIPLIFPRGGYSVNTDYVKVPIFLRQFDLVKSQLSHGLYPPLFPYLGGHNLVMNTRFVVGA